MLRLHFDGNGSRHNPNIYWLDNESDFDKLKGHDFTNGVWESPGYYASWLYTKPCHRGCCTDHWMEKEYLGSNIEDTITSIISRDMWDSDMGKFVSGFAPAHIRDHLKRPRMVDGEIYFTIQCHQCGDDLKYLLLDGERQLAIAGWEINNHGATCPDCE